MSRARKRVRGDSMRHTHQACNHHRIRLVRVSQLIAYASCATDPTDCSTTGPLLANKSVMRGVSMRRSLLMVGLVIGLCLSAAHPQGQRGPTLSDDLKDALARGERVRVIVQAEENALQSLRSRLGRGLRRQLAGALSLDLTPQELSALKTDG